MDGGSLRKSVRVRQLVHTEHIVLDVYIFGLYWILQATPVSQEELRRGQALLVVLDETLAEGVAARSPKETVLLVVPAEELAVEVLRLTGSEAVGEATVEVRTSAADEAEDASVEFVVVFVSLLVIARLFHPDPETLIVPVTMLKLYTPFYTYQFWSCTIVSAHIAPRGDFY